MSVAIIAAFRTPVMPQRGAFAALEPHDLAIPLVQACLAAGGVTPDEVDEVILANTLGPGGNPARLVALGAGLPDRVAGLTIDRQCAGGLDAILLARALILSGQAEVVLAGGAESHSRRPVRMRRAPGGGPLVAYDQAPFTPWPDRDPLMADAAAALARHLGIGRAAQDDWAVQSHARARAAADRLAAEMVPLAGVRADGFTRSLTPATAARAAAISGSITAANTAVAADAAALCLVVSGRIAARVARPCWLLAGATRGSLPDRPGTAPLVAVRDVLARTGLTPADLAQAEVMEAYAVQAIACVQGAGLDPARVNPGGGALARGHPIGASGAILAVRLFHDLQDGPGLATIAAAGGIGTALVLQAGGRRP